MRQHAGGGFLVRRPGGVRIAGLATAFHVGEILVTPQMHHFIDRTDRGREIGDQIADMLHLHRQRLFFENLQVFLIAAVGDRVSAVIDNHLRCLLRV